MPLLLAAGALAGTGQLSILASLFIVTLAAVTADSIWYQLGRRKGIKVLQFLCKISLEPDSCVRRTEGVFSKQGARSLVLAKFLPGLEHRCPAARRNLPHARHAAFCSSMLLGLFSGPARFSDSATFSAERSSASRNTQPLSGAGCSSFSSARSRPTSAYKFLARQTLPARTAHRPHHRRRTEAKIDAGEELVIVDLRHSMDFEADPETIPGAFRMDAKELEEKNDRLPRDREIILYCT